MTYPHWNRVRRVAALVLGLTLLMPAVATADDLIHDGDGTAPVASATLEFGNLCIGQTYQDNILVGIMRNWTDAAGPNDPVRVFGNGASLSLSVVSDTHAALSASMGADAQIVLPSNWLDTSVWTRGRIFQGDHASLNVSVTPSATGLSGTQQITVRASGVNASGSIINRAVETAKVTWTGVTCDSTPPVITPNVTGTLGSNGWYTSNVGVTWTVVDNESTISSSTGCGPTTISADTAGTVVTCSATSAGGNAQQSVTIKRDATQPQVTVTGVSNGATYTLGSVPTAGCTTSDVTSGVQTNASLGSSGGPVGSVTATCSGALDNAGNSGSASATYTVEYAFTGFFQPVDNLPAFNQVKAGSAVPVKFSLGGNQGLGIMATGFPKSQPIACDSSDPLDTVEETVTAGSSGLSYDSTTNQYTYVWKTQKAWTGCRQLIVELIDGSSHAANFKFTK